MWKTMTFEIVSEPEKVRLVLLLHEGYEMTYDGILRELGVKPKQLESLLKSTKELWKTPMPKIYRLTERGNIAYGIIKSRNIKIKKVAKKMEKKRSPMSQFLSSVKEEISRRFL